MIRGSASNPNPDTNQSDLPGGADLGSVRGIAAESAGTQIVAVDNAGCRGIARVTPSVPGTSCFGEGACFETPFGVAVMDPEPGAAARHIARIEFLTAR